MGNIRKLLSIDYSTTASGWAVFDMDTKLPLSYGVITPTKNKRSLKDSELKRTLDRLNDMAEQLRALIEKENPEKIVIEEVNRGISRTGQKVLCGGHYILYSKIEKWLPIVRMVDSDGRAGWRGPNGLNLTLSENDKASNKKNKLLNKVAKRGFKHVIFTKKDLCQRYINFKYKLSFDVQKNLNDNDVCDALGIGAYWLDKCNGK